MIILISTAQITASGVKFCVLGAAYPRTWWRHLMETFSALLAICAGNSLVSGEFPAQRSVTRNFGVFFDLRLNKRLSKQSWGWWFETLSHPLWRHRNEYTEIIVLEYVQTVIHNRPYKTVRVLQNRFVTETSTFSWPNRKYAKLLYVYNSILFAPAYTERLSYNTVSFR